MSIKKLTAICILLFSCFTVSAQTDPFFPMNPSTIGKGGSYTADAQGYNSFFYNPAGFAGNSELTLLSVNGWSIMDKNLTTGFWNAVIKNDFSYFNSLIPKGAVQSRVGLMDDFASLQTNFQAYIDYFTNAQTVDSSAFSNVLDDVLANSPDIQVLLGSINSLELQDAIVSGSYDSIDFSAVAATVLQNPEILANVLTDMVEAIQNPALGFDAGELATITGTTPAPTAADAAALTKAINSSIASIGSQLPKGSIDFGLNIGTAWVGNGIGVGLFIEGSGYVRTPLVVDTADGVRDGTILDAKSRVFTTITLAGGIGFELFDGLSIGVGIRPTVISYGELNLLNGLNLIQNPQTDIMSTLNVLMDSGVNKIFYLGLDAGALLELGDFTFGATIKDIIPSAKYFNYNTVNGFIEDLTATKDPFTTANAVEIEFKDGMYYIPAWSINVGAKWQPDMGMFSALFQPTVGADIFDLFSFVRYFNATEQDQIKLTDYNLLNYIGIGCEAKLFSLATVQAGFYRGSVTAGFGLDLFIGELNTAVMFRDFNFNTFDFREAGVSFEVALRL